ncbi:hypothetical protein PV08_07379 [Exophiala spinifera]|uniref:Major facilitator superfamily (MFS) profile domain-containing protein n=1 Tax=Exophiala spinifera TaxID=91928 RepID=A0A0D2B7F3_9EURO|nr:uncharacterized protein PV08_07379 [Exophiala spinifera]KIW14595.1 hypothetical protein PV08_07379 [Exophiala spinifera]
MEEQSAARIDTTPPEKDDILDWRPFRTSLLLLAICSQYFCQLLFIVGSGVYPRDIAAVVGGESIASWPASSIVILTAAFAPPVAQAADYWGRKWLLVIPTSFGLIGSIVVATAQSMQVAIVGFVLGGVSFGAQPLVHAVGSEIIPRKYRSYAQACVNSSIALGAITSLTVGGALTNNHPAGFRTYWYICAGVYAFSTIIMAVLYNPPPRDLQLSMTLKQKLRALDWTGYMLFDTGLVLFCLGLSYSQNPFNWPNAHILAPFVIGSTVLIVLIIYEVRFKKDGLFHHGLFRHRNFSLALAGVTIEGFAFNSANVYFPYEMETVISGISTFRVLVCYAVGFVTLFVVSTGVGIYIHKTRTVRGPAMASFIGFLIFFVLMATNKASTPEAHFWGFITFYGAGLGTCLITLITAAQLTTPPELISITSGLLGSLRSVGGAIGVAIPTAIFHHGLTSNLVPKVTAAVEPLGLSGSAISSLIGDLTGGQIEAAAKLPGITPQILEAAKLAITKAYVVGFRDVFICTAAFAFLGLVLSAFLRNPTEQFNSHIDAPLDKIPIKVSDSETNAGDSKHLETTENVPE